MNSYGKTFRVTLYGESHGPSIGCVIDGMKPGVPVDTHLIENDLTRRRPHQTGSTKRVEKDRYTITSGVYQGYTTGAPIHVSIFNDDVDSTSYLKPVFHPRPNHVDYVAHIKYQGFEDPRGGGFFSGRLTAALVVAGSFAKMMLPYAIESKLIQVGTLKDMNHLDQYIQEIEDKKDSVGGVIEVKVSGLPVGLGEPFFGKLDAEIAHILFSIPSIKGVAFGDGFEGVERLGSAFNDSIIDRKGTTKTNHSGGVVGGISNGNDVIIKVFVKPTSSIGIPQETFSFASNALEPLLIEGRHDACIARRLGVVLENAVAIVLANLSSL